MITQYIKLSLDKNEQLEIMAPKADCTLAVSELPIPDRITETQPDGSPNREGTMNTQQLSEQNPAPLTKNNSDEIITVSGLAKLLDLAIPSVYALIHQKKIPYYKPTGKRVYFRKSEIEAWAFLKRIASQDEIDTQAATRLVNGGK